MSVKSKVKESSGTVYELLEVIFIIYDILNKLYPSKCAVTSDWNLRTIASKYSTSYDGPGELSVTLPLPKCYVPAERIHIKMQLTRDNVLLFGFKSPPNVPTVFRFNNSTASTDHIKLTQHAACGL